MESLFTVTVISAARAGASSEGLSSRVNRTSTRALRKLCETIVGSVASPRSLDMMSYKSASPMISNCRSSSEKPRVAGRICRISVLPCGASIVRIVFTSPSKLN